MATHSSILARKFLWTEEPGGLQSMGSQRVRHIEATEYTGNHEHMIQFSLVHRKLREIWIISCHILLQSKTNSI